MRSCISVFRPALLALFVSASGSAGADAAVENPRIGRAADLYELIPEYQPDTYRNMDKVYPTRVIHKGTKVRPLPAGVAIAPRYRIGGEEYGVDDFMRRNRVGGVLVLKDGKVALERYGLGNDERTRWTSFSVVKSISSTLVGAAVQQGLLALDQPVDKYLPSLAGSAYQGVTVEQVLQMSSGVRWNETYRDPKSDRRQMFDAQLAERPGGILRLLASLPRQYPSGTHFTYSTGESHLQSELLHAATRIPVSDYLSERIWARMGMESDGFWQLESPAGQEIGSSGLSATLRDYGRFGQFVLEDGVIDGERILPEGWVDRASRVEASSTWPRASSTMANTRSATATSGGPSRWAPRPCPSMTAGPSKPRASSASTSTSTARRRSWRWSGAPGRSRRWTIARRRPMPSLARR